jgi:carbamoyl-phosphate synthase large subunit
LITKRNILVTSVGGRSVGSGIMHSLLRVTEETKNRWNIVATDADPFAWGLYLTENKELLPMAKHPDYFTVLNKVIKKHNIEAIIPGSEIEASVLSNHKEKFDDITIVANDRDLMPLMMDKLFMHEKLKSLGINCIETFPLHNWASVIKKFGYPVIVKPAVGTGGSRGVMIISNEKELTEVLNQETKDLCIQPYIGNENEEYTVGVLTDKNGNLIDSIVMKRKLIGLSLLQSKNIADKTFSISSGYSQGYIIKDEKIQDFCEGLAITIGSKGPLNIQLRVHQGQIYVFEVHPRFSGTTPIRASAGFNEVDILLRNYLMGETFGRINYQYNVAAIRAFEHVLVPLEQMPQNHL